jgi:phage replication-related protein YjqB (UPF0714/DUF867 family)
MTDKYKNFEDLKSSRKEHEDFEIELVDMGSDYSILAIHGGNIEPGTTEIAKVIAADKLSYYSFVGKKSEEECNDLHITSANFDEPLCCELINKSQKIISIHGERGPGECVMVGGLDKDLVQEIAKSLSEKGFNVENPPDRINGDYPVNVCNRGLSGRGAQLEVSRGLRNSLISNPDRLSIFCNCISSLLT